MSNEIINFDELENIRQANVRESQYQLKRMGNDKFTITKTGKLVIGYNATKGINLKAGNGLVVMGVLSVDDKRCTSGLLHGAVGQAFRSNTLEKAIVENGIEADFYTFENPQVYQEVTYYTLVPVVATEESTTASDPVDDSEDVSQNDPAPEIESPSFIDAPEEPNTPEEVESESKNDEF